MAFSSFSMRDARRLMTRRWDMYMDWNGWNEKDRIGWDERCEYDQRFDSNMFPAYAVVMIVIVNLMNMKRANVLVKELLIQ
jgi:hypothetical protein